MVQDPREQTLRWIQQLAAIERPSASMGAQLTPAAIGKVLVDPPSGMPSYESLAAEKRGALMRYLSGLR